MDSYSLSDIRAATDGSMDGFGGGWMWIIVLFLFLFGAGGNGFVNRGSEIQAGFDTAEVTRKLDGIANGLSDGFYAQNTTMLTGFGTINSNIADCCCQTRLGIADLAAQGDRNTCAITTAVHEEGEKTRALMRENEIQALRDKVQSLELNGALCGVVRYPTAITYGAGYSPFFGGYGYGCGCNTNI